jgi:SPP1 family predicted phage head-tail adaptor
LTLNPGELRHTVDLQRDHVTRVNGVESRIPETYATCRASITYLSGTELFKAQAVNTEVNVRVVIRYRTDVLAAHRVIYKGKALEIKAVIPDEAHHKQLTLECKG